MRSLAKQCGCISLPRDLNERTDHPVTAAVMEAPLSPSKDHLVCTQLPIHQSEANRDDGFIEKCLISVALVLDSRQGAANTRRRQAA